MKDPGELQPMAGKPRRLTSLVRMQRLWIGFFRFGCLWAFASISGDILASQISWHKFNGGGSRHSGRMSVLRSNVYCLISLYWTRDCEKRIAASDHGEMSRLSLTRNRM